MKFRNALLPTGTEISVISTGLGSGPDERGFEERVWLGRECRVVAPPWCNFPQRLLQSGRHDIFFNPLWQDHGSQQLLHWHTSLPRFRRYYSVWFFPNG